MTEDYSVATTPNFDIRDVGPPRLINTKIKLNADRPRLHHLSHACMLTNNQLLNCTDTKRQYLKISNMTHHESILQAILGLPQMKDKTLIHLSIVGSRSKGLASPDSDYDLKAVILRSRNDYLLQKITPSKSFAVDIIDPNTGKAIDVEGTFVDYLTMQGYVLKSNQAAYDALFGIPLHTTKESMYLMDLYYRAYNPRSNTKAHIGLLRAEQKRAEKKHQESSIKHAANMIYYATAVHIFQISVKPPLADAFYRLEKLDIEPELREQMKSLYEKRKLDKSSSGYDMTPFLEFIRSADELEVRVEGLSPMKEQSLREEANEEFLSLFPVGPSLAQHS